MYSMDTMPLLFTTLNKDVYSYIVIPTFSSSHLSEADDSNDTQSSQEQACHETHYSSDTIDSWRT